MVGCRAGGLVGYIPGVVRVGLVCWVYSWGGGGRAGELGIGVVRVGLVSWVYSWQPTGNWLVLLVNG